MKWSWNTLKRFLARKNVWTGTQTVSDLVATTADIQAGSVSADTYGSDDSITDAELRTIDDGATTEILVGGGAGSSPVWTAATGTGAPVRATSPTLITPEIGVATGTSLSSGDATLPFVLNATTLATDGVLIGNKTAIGTWVGDGVSSAGTANITDVGGAAHGLSIAVGDLVHISAATTASHEGFYRIVTAGATTIVLDRTLTATDTDLTVTFYKDVIGIFATDGTNGQRIMNYSHQDKPLQIGGDVLAATGHSLGAGDVLIGGLLEVDGASHFDGALNAWGTVVSDKSSGRAYKMAANSGSYVYLGATEKSVSDDVLVLMADFSKDQAVIFVGDEVGNQLILANDSFLTSDFDHAAQTNPTLYIHSDTGPDVSNNQWGSFYHDQEDFVITTGANTGAGSAPTTDENGVKIFPRSGSAGVHVKGDGTLAMTSAAIQNATTTLSAAGPTDDLDVSGVNVVFINTNGNNVTLGGMTGGVSGQAIDIVIIDAGNNTILEHAEATGNQDIYLESGGDETKTASYGGWRLVCNGTHWYEGGGSK